MNNHIHGNMIHLHINARIIGECLMCFVPRTSPGVKAFTVIAVDLRILAKCVVHRIIANLECEKASRAWYTGTILPTPSGSSMFIFPPE